MKRPTILLYFRLSSAWDRGVAQGIMELGRERNWNIVLGSTAVALPEVASTWQPSAIVGSCELVRTVSPEPAQHLLLISVGQDASAQGIASICPDDQHVGRLAAQHLMRTGLKDTAVFAYDDSAFGRERAAGFRETILAGGGAFHEGGAFSGDPGSPRFCSHTAIIAWLQSLPRPCGIFAMCDDWASPVATYCRHLGLQVPDDVALIGVDNDPLVCELSSPPLSSVAIPWRELSRAAVTMIEHHLAGRNVKAACTRVKPVDVVARRSTDRLSIDDATVADAVAWIRSNAHHAISVDDVLRAVPTYRQRLERQFRARLGRTVVEEVRRAHIDLARTLLMTTQLHMPDIAARSGFTNATLLGINFRKELGMTPSEYRRRFRGDAQQKRKGPA